MKIAQNKLNYTGKITTKKQNKNKEINQLQKDLELTTLKLKQSKSKKDKLMAKFLANNYIHPETGLITSKVKWNSREISCGLNEIR
jgi:hypothetical protein